MQEIANRFKEEYTELLSRYKDQLTNAQLMPIIQSVTMKELGWTNRPELIEKAKRFMSDLKWSKWTTPRTEDNIKKECIESEKLRKELEGVWVVADKEPY